MAYMLTVYADTYAIYALNIHSVYVWHMQQIHSTCAICTFNVYSIYVEHKCSVYISLLVQVL